MPRYRAGQMGQEEVRPQFSLVACLDLGFVQVYLVLRGRATSFPGQLQSTIDETHLPPATREGIPVSLPN